MRKETRRTMSAAAAATADTTPPKPKAGRKKLVVILALVLLLVAGAAGAAVYILKRNAAAAAAAAEADGDPAPTHAAAAGHRTPPAFVPLEPFIVNLADHDGERFAQVGLTLEVDDPKFGDEMKNYMPAVRNAILMILAHKTSQELLAREGKQALAEEIMREAVRPMGIEIDPPEAEAAAEETSTRPARKPRKKRPPVHNPVQRVHFSSFIIQ